MKLNQRQSSQLKGITAEGPNKLNRKGNPLKFKKHRKKGSRNLNHNAKSKKILSIKSNSKLRNQLASLRQSTRPVVNRNINNDNKRIKKQKKKKNSALVQALQWNKAKSSKLSFGSLTKRSLLFSIEQLAKMDKITIYYIGKSGLTQLAEINDTFDRYKDTLFNQKRVLFGGSAMNKMMTFDRSANDNLKENEFIDTEIISLLRDLTDYFLLEEAHKVLEFLISHYKIHLNYPLFALECCFPYYSTVTFARFIQLIEFSHHKWQLLFLNVQKSLTPLTKQILTNQCLKDMSILQFIQQMHLKHNTKSQMVAQFYTEVMMNVVNKNQNELLLIQLMPSILANVQRSSAHIVLNFIASKVQLNASQIHEIINSLLINKTNEKNLLTLDHIMDSQHVNALNEQFVLTLDQDRDMVMQIWLNLNDKFNIKLPFIVAKQLITSQKHNAFLIDLLTQFEFQKQHQVMICDMVLAHHRRDIMDILKNNIHYGESLNKALWKDKGAKIGKNPQLIDWMISNHNLQYVLRSSLSHANEDITVAVLNTLEVELKQNRLNAPQATELLIETLMNTKATTKTKQRAITILFERKSQLISQDNASSLTKTLSNLKVNLAPLDRCHLFELLCFGIQMMGNDNGNDKTIMTVSNCCIIDILSNAPQDCTASLLNILSKYHSTKILIHSAHCNVDNLLQKIGENMVLNWKQFMRIIPYLSMQSICLLLMCAKQMMLERAMEDATPQMIRILLKMSNHLSPQTKQHEVTALICHVFYLCVQNIGEHQNMTWMVALIEKESKLLQILVHVKGETEMIELLLKLLKLLKLSKRRKTKTKAKCLYLLSVLLQKVTYETRNRPQLCHLVASLLFYLNTDNKVIRFCAIQCFKSIYGKLKNGGDSDSDCVLVRMIHQINRFEVDILEDKQTLNRMLCNAFVNLSVPMVQLFVDYKQIDYDLLALFVPLLVDKGKTISGELLNDICHRMCQYLMDNKYQMESAHWAQCVVEVCALNSINCIRFEYIHEWISQHHMIAIVPSLTASYWSQLTFDQQKQLYLSLETLLDTDSQRQIVEFILRVPLSTQMMQYWLRKEEETATTVTRIQLVISKINNETIDKDTMNAVVMPLVMSLLKDTHLRMQSQHKNEEDLQSLNWMRSMVLSALIRMIECVKKCSIDMDILLDCVQYEWLFANGLFIQLICVLGQYLPKLLLKIYVPFLQLMTNNIKKVDTRDVVFVSLLSAFFESTIECIAPFLKGKELRQIIVASMALLNELTDSDLELQYISKLLRSFVAAGQKKAVLIAFDIMNTNEDNYTMSDMNRLLFNATNRCIDVQLTIILNILSNSNSRNRKPFLGMIEHHLNHSIFIKEFALIVSENREEIPHNIDALNTKIFKRLFDLLYDSNDECNLVIHKCLDAVRGLLSLRGFGSIINDLITKHKNKKKKQKKKRLKSMQLLLDQMHQKSQRFKLNDVKYYLKELIIPLHDELEHMNDVQMRQHIVCILELTMKKFDNYVVVNEWLATVIPSLILRLENKNESKVIVGHMMLLLSTAMRTLKSNRFKSLFLNHLSLILSTNLDILQREKEDELLLISSAFCLECVVSEYNDYIGRHLEQILACVLSEGYLQLNLKLYHAATINSIASFESRKLIQCLHRTFDALAGALNATSFETYFNVIHLMMMQWKTRQQTLECYKHLFELFKHCMDHEEVMDKFECLILKCLSDLVLKLTDKEMMQIMEELIFWIEEFEINSARYSVRTLSLFRFLCHCLHRFKNAFCGIALFAYNLAVKCLVNTEQPPAKKQKTNQKENKALLLRRRRSNAIMQTIQLTLKYGREDKLIDKATFLMLLPVIVGQIRNGFKWRDDIMYIAYFEKYITPTIVCLANTTKDINLWNELNKHILSLCGHKKSIIRSAAVDALLGLFSLMGHAWLNCLPQTLHYINELLQDDDDDVLQRTKSLIQRIELLTQSKLNNLT